MGSNAKELIEDYLAIDSNLKVEDDKKPKCKIIGTDGNVFAIISKVTKALRDAGQPEKAKEFQSKAFDAGSYDQVLSMLDDYVDVY